ncbi:MAG: type II secretion system F family protein [Verrucomicrobiales bacterium]
MLKRVALTNVNTGRKVEVIVDTDTDDKALIGSGRAPNETAKVLSVTGADEALQRATIKKPSMDDRVALFAGIARCLDRNISTIKSFELQANRVKSPRYKGAIAEISSRIAQGEKVSDAMSEFKDLFGDDVLALIRAGEEAGQLPEVCKRIASGQKKTLRILKKLKAGMIYPGIVLTMAVGVIILMSFTLVPEVKKLYGSYNAKLPLPTVVMMKTSDVLIHYPYLAILPFFLIFLFFKKWGRIYAKPTVQKALINVPTAGTIIRKSAAAVSFRCLAMLMEANVRISTALRITSEGAPHIYYREFFGRVQKHIEDGLLLSEAFLMESHWLGPDGRNICGILEISAETGSATDMLNEIADDYEDELDTIAGQIDKILEPITILVLGIIVGFLIYAIYGPIFGLGKVILPDVKKGVGGRPPTPSAVR